MAVAIFVFIGKHTREIIAQNNFTSYTGKVGIVRLRGQTYLTITPGQRVIVPPVARSLFVPTTTYNVHFINLLGAFGSGIVLSIAPSEVKVSFKSKESGT